MARPTPHTTQTDKSDYRRGRRSPKCGVNVDEQGGVRVLLVRRALDQGLDASQVCLTPGSQAFSAVVHLRSELAQNHLELPELAVHVVIGICQQTGRLRPSLLDDRSSALTGGLEHVGPVSYT